MSASTGTIQRPIGQGSIFGAVALAAAVLLATIAIAWGAMNLAALNVANAIGAWAGSLTIAAGYGLLSAEAARAQGQGALRVRASGAVGYAGGVTFATRQSDDAFALVIVRYLLGLGSVWLTETVVYAHATVFMLAAAWTLQVGGHVRVDIFYADASARTKALIDLVGALVLLLPFMIVLIWLSVPYAARSWSILERSQEASGLPLVFLLKTLIPLFALLMALQGIAQAIRAVAVLARAR